MENLSTSTRTALFKERMKEFVGLRGLALLRRKLAGKSFLLPSFYDRRLIFIHVPKDAGTSLGEALFGSSRTGHFEWF